MENKNEAIEELSKFLLDNLTKLPNFKTKNFWKSSQQTSQGKLHSLNFIVGNIWKEISKIE